MKINKTDAMATNTKHVGLLLFEFVINYFYFFYFLLGKGGSDQSLGDGRKMPPGLLAVGGTPKPHKLPRAAVRGPAVGGEPPVRWAAGYGFPPRLIVRTLGR